VDIEMFLKLLRSKLHRAAVTDTILDYPGSLAIDADLMEKAGIMEYESVMIADVNNGNRLETYAIPAPAGSGQIIVLGAAAKLINPKDRVIIFTFGFFSEEEAKTHKPKVLSLDENNKIVKVIF
jgi:aspartate 1-decarboxylase